jgi:hypothetical protein
MGQIVRPADIIARLSEIDSKDIIYAREAWTEGSDAMIASEVEDNVLPPPETTEASLADFLEIFTASEVVEDWIAYLSD